MSPFLENSNEACFVATFISAPFFNALLPLCALAVALEHHQKTVLQLNS